jgi:protein-tyrosine phosphatase
LDKYKIYNIVNCKGNDGQNYFEKNEKFSYLRFNIQNWRNKPFIDTPEGVLIFFEPLHKFIETALEKGQNVMVHCMAGAHRAGTAGVSYMMRGG